ncbi:11697_t:CDS:2 [Scutellospora calospora]|uniref:11697_t:CDS:1 n=1 Tax=Scutellospora calospora TaxID=85575 RepID=A0ACA9KHK0_9GLOM|nr:11697_t:CDS:2 [Scutellospora calospora]
MPKPEQPCIDEVNVDAEICSDSDKASFDKSNNRNKELPQSDLATAHDEAEVLNY